MDRYLNIIHGFLSGSLFCAAAIAFVEYIIAHKDDDVCIDDDELTEDTDKDSDKSNNEKPKGDKAEDNNEHKE
jgi:hypothetical protein